MHGDEILQNAAITRIIQHFAGKEIVLASPSGEEQRWGEERAAARSTEEVSGGMAQRSAGPQPLIVTGQYIRDGASSGRRGGARLF
ncbi:hypothetical protein EFT36_11520 [Raoultella ornithinolytica]|nr:hypothetical protein EFT36_11520 [Raoultella ornithinolytica]